LESHPLLFQTARGALIHATDIFSKPIRYQTRIHFDRTSGGDFDHRHADVTNSASDSERSQCGEADAVSESHAAGRAGSPADCRTEQRTVSRCWTVSKDSEKNLGEGTPTPSSDHHGIVNVVMASGATRSLSDSIDAVVYAHLITPKGTARRTISGKTCSGVITGASFTPQPLLSQDFW
jgi:hypothetical protein